MSASPTPQWVISAGPANGWHYCTQTFRFIRYRHGRMVEWVAVEAWRDYRRAHRGLIPL